MINLSILSSEIAHIVGKADDIVTVRRIKVAAMDYCTRYIRDSIMSNKIIHPSFVCKVGKRVQTIEPMSEFYVSNRIFCRETVNFVETPIRLTDNVPFLSVSSPTSQILFAYSDLETIQFELDGKCSAINKYIYVNNKIAIYSNNPLLMGFNMLKVSIIPESPLDLIDEAGKLKYDEEHYPAPADLKPIIKREIMKELFPDLTPSIKEVDVSDSE